MLLVSAVIGEGGGEFWLVFGMLEFSCEEVEFDWEFALNLELSTRTMRGKVIFENLPLWLEASIGAESREAEGIFGGSFVV